MPRKTDGIPFILQPRPTKGADGKPLLYAQLMPGRRLTLDWLDTEFRGQGRYQPGDVKRMFEVFATVVGRYLADGYRIETPIGSFAPRLKIDGDYTEPASVCNGSADLAGIEFTPSQRLRREVKEHYRGCRKINTVVGNAQMYDERAMQKALRACMAHSDFITVRDFSIYSKLKLKSARHFLDSLCEGDTPRLRRVKRGRILLYFPLDQDEEQVLDV